MHEPVIAIQNVSKTYANGFAALKDVSLDIAQGEIFGLLGPNGAGKTTLINIVAGLTKKTAGEVRVFGKDVEKDYQFTRRAIGLGQQEINADYYFTVEEMIRTQGGYFGIPPRHVPVERILKSLDLWDKRNANGRQLSGGMKRRVMVAKALVHDPEIVFLDEPTAGVDVELRGNLWQLIRDLKARGKTIILTTHYLEEAEELADRIGIIFDGKIAMVEETKALIKRYGENLNDAYRTIVHASANNRP